MTDRLFAECCYGTDQQHPETQPCPQDDAGVLGKLCADSITPALFEPAIKKVADELYMTLMETVQDWLCDNVEQNIASRIQSAEDEARRLRKELYDLDTVLGVGRSFTARADRVRDLTRAEVGYVELIFAVASKHEGETRHHTALRYIREREDQCAEPAQGMSARQSQDAQRLGPEAASPVPEGDAPQGDLP